MAQLSSVVAEFADEVLEVLVDCGYKAFVYVAAVGVQLGRA